MSPFNGLLLTVVLLLGVVILQHWIINQMRRQLLARIILGPDDDGDDGDDGEPLQLPLAENDDDVRKLRPGMLYRTRDGVIHVRRAA